MLNKIQTWFEVRLQTYSEGQQTAKPIELAAAVLMLEVAKADFEDVPSEQAQIVLALRETFDLGDHDIEELLSMASETINNTVSLHAFVRTLNESFTLDERIQLIEHLWRVAYADGRVDKYEDHTIRKLSDLLYVPHRDFISAKHRAERLVKDE